MQHSLMLVPESQTQAFNLVIMCKFFSALPIFHSSGCVSSWATLGCKWVSKWNKGIKKGNRLFRQEKQCQGGEMDAFLYPWDVKSPITCSAQSVKTRKPQMKKNHRSREKIFLALTFYGLSQSLYQFLMFDLSLWVVTDNQKWFFYL